jgi:hypothetical protein
MRDATMQRAFLLSISVDEDSVNVPSAKEIPLILAASLMSSKDGLSTTPG